jgi:hypothetical protein
MSRILFLGAFFFIALALALAAGAAYSWVASPATEAIRQADIQYQIAKGQQDLAFREAIHPALVIAATATIISIPTVLIVVGLGLAWLIYRRAQLVYPDRRGFVPSDYNRLRAGDYDAHAMAAVTGFHAAKIEAARNPALPAPVDGSRVNYAPRYPAPRIIGQDPRAPQPSAFEVSAPAALPLPGPVDLAGLLSAPPTLDRVLLALGPGGEQLVASAKDMTHIALAGSTGGGKSNILRMLLAQVLAGGAQGVLADPHYAPIDPENGEDWRPIERRLAAPPAVTPAQIADLLAWLSDELQRRLELRRRGELVGRPVYFAADELPAIVAHVPGADAVLGEIVREGRKVRIFALVSAQDWLTKTVGGSQAMKENFRTCYYTGGDKSTARLLLDLQGRVDDAGLGAGLAWLRSRATPTAQLVRVPLASNAALVNLLPTPSPAPQAYGATPPVGGASFGTYVPAPPSAIITPRSSGPATPLGGGASDEASWDPIVTTPGSSSSSRAFYGQNGAKIVDGRATTTPTTPTTPTTAARRPVTLLQKAEAAGIPLTDQERERVGLLDQKITASKIAERETGYSGGGKWSRIKRDVENLKLMIENWPDGEKWGGQTLESVED